VKSALWTLFTAACVCALVAPENASAAVRTYYIASDEVTWHYAPSGRDLITGRPLPPLNTYQLGLTYRKVVYREYTDATFRKLLPRSAADAYMGLVGPAIHAEVGDTVVIFFKNHASIPTNVAAAGIEPDRVAPVKPGSAVRYTWHITDDIAPGVHDGSSIGWRYYSTVDETNDESTGMFGPLIVTRRGDARADGAPADVEREAFVAFSEVEEGLSRMAAANVADPAINPRRIKQGPTLSPFTFDNELYTINGFVFGNMPMLTLREGERTRWYVIVTGASFDAHTPHWHGQTVLDRGMRTDIIDAQINEVRVVDMVPDNPGVWLFHCHVRLHLAGGMEARFAVTR
jgi:manganese oxidase